MALSELLNRARSSSSVRHASVAMANAGVAGVGGLAWCDDVWEVWEVWEV